MKPLPTQSWYHPPIEVALAAFENSPQAGLTDGEGHLRQARFGMNVLTIKRGRSLLTRFILQFLNALNGRLYVRHGNALMCYEVAAR
jgi:hypothetical protein